MPTLLVSILLLLASLIIGYLFGTIPTGVILSNLLFHEDVRNAGSGNSGGTNVARTYGRKFGVLVIAIDMIKTVIPVYAIWAIMTFTPLSAYNFGTVNVGNAMIGGAAIMYWAAGLAAAFGHCWPVFTGFKGGKAVACFMGLNTLTNWFNFIFSGFGYLFIAKKCKFISATSIAVSIIGTVIGWGFFVLEVFAPSNIPGIFMWNFGLCPFIKYGLEFAVMNTGIMILLILRHRQNIARLKQGTESKNPFLKESK